jgi:hypothetical protein
MLRTVPPGVRIELKTTRSNLTSIVSAFDVFLFGPLITEEKRSLEPPIMKCDVGLVYVVFQVSYKTTVCFVNFLLHFARCFSNNLD